jgi:hypothetical protein
VVGSIGLNAVHPATLDVGSGVPVVVIVVVVVVITVVLPAFACSSPGQTVVAVIVVVVVSATTRAWSSTRGDTSSLEASLEMRSLDAASAPGRTAPKITRRASEVILQPVVLRH